MFIGREDELSTLNRLYESNKFELAVIYGRRRVGKTALINKFIAGKNAIYFTGLEYSGKQNLELLGKCILEYEGGAKPKGSFLSLQAALEYAFKLSKKERLILAIDEYQTIDGSSNDIGSALQFLTEKYATSSKLMLILCGSPSYMEERLLDPRLLLSARVTARIELLPFDFEGTCRFFPDSSDEAKALFYGICGGIPKYLLQMDDRLSIKENIKNTYLNPESFLFEEPKNFLRDESRRSPLYSSVIAAIAGGATHMTGISNCVGEPANVCSTYLKTLAELGIVQREMPFRESGTRKFGYNVRDNMLRFWFRFVPESLPLIIRGDAGLAYERIEPQLEGYMKRIFEDICMQFLWKTLRSGRSPIRFASLERWWGKEPMEKCFTGIVIVGEQDKDTALFCSCEWAGHDTGLDALDKLIENKGFFLHTNAHYCLFSRTGFTRGCIAAAREMGNVSLVTYKDILENTDMLGAF